MKIEHEHYKNIFIIDTGGLMSPEKNNKEFDNKILLFILAVSNIVLINIKGDLHLPMKNLIQMCGISLH